VEQQAQPPSAGRGGAPLEARLAELERAVQRLEATTEIARAIGDETRLDRTLELIVDRGRALVDARAMLILLRERGELLVAAAAGRVFAATPGARVPIADDATGRALREQRTLRLTGEAARLALAEPVRSGRARALLLVPLIFRERTLGLLAAVDQLGPAGEFSAEDEELMLAFAASAATAVATAQSVEGERLRHSMRAAEAERRRWARELHDQTLLGLGAVRRILGSALRSGDPERLREGAEVAIAQIREEIEALRAIIADLRPAALDELGLGPALASLVDRAATGAGLGSELMVDVGDGDGESGRLEPELETVVYRLVQEAVTNAVRHAGATHVLVSVVRDGDELAIAVADDGRGFDPGAPAGGYGLAGMRERAALVDGTVSIESSGQGTTVRARLPVRLRGDGA
jgi:signal transduction histidine kinase